jgi:hypothetical protein
MLKLSDKWAAVLARQRETGMGYQVGTVLLKDGRKFEGVVVVGGIISRVAGAESIPFVDDDIESILVTHDPVRTSPG